MDRDRFLKQVTERGALSSKDESERAVRATLQTLAERIVGDEATDLAAQLPPEFGDALAGSSAEGERFGLDEFVSRVATRAGLDNAAAEQTAQAIFAVIRDAVTPGGFDDVVAQLPNDYRPLLATAGGMPGRHT
jgi:uncharacterized protein (DUF2267 family)